MQNSAQVFFPFDLVNCQIVVKVNTSSVRAVHFIIGKIQLSLYWDQIWIYPTVTSLLPSNPENLNNDMWNFARCLTKIHMLLHVSHAGSL